MQEIKVPDIGDFDAVEIIEILVSPGDTVEAEQPLITLESDKATMEVPSPAAGKIVEVVVAEGDKVSEGDVIAKLEAGDGQPAGEDSASAASQPADKQASKPVTAVKAPAGDADIQCDVVVLGAGPGGYTAAFRAADLGLNTVMVERYPSLGGVCLNVGCIPSKALLHTAHVIEHAAAMADHGVSFGEPNIDLDGVRGFKESVVGKLTGGLVGLAKQRKVTVVQGVGKFSSPNTMAVTAPDGSTQTIGFKNAIIAAGSQAIAIPSFPNDDSRLIDSTGALELQDVPGRMLVVGGGIIGLEMVNVYSALGARIDVVELSDQLIPGCDRDLVKPLQKSFEKRCENMWINVGVESIEATDGGLVAHFGGDKAPEPQTYDRILVAVGRSPNGGKIDADKAGVEVTERGFINVDSAMRTNVPHIYAIGDLAGQPMLAHKATHEAKVAAENCAGEKSHFDARCIPSVMYTDPEVAWVGLTETEAKADGIKYEKGQFPWAANGRSLGMDNSDGALKILFDPETEHVIGAGAVGPNVGELMAELGLAIEMGADMHDIGMTIHAHPTLSEAVGMAAEAAAGTLTDLYLPKKK